MRIIGVGNAVVDLIDCVAQFPSEDSELRALSRETRSGGNTLNSLVVLAQLGHACHLVSTLADDVYAGIIYSVLNSYKIDTSNCVRCEGSATPLSHITVSRLNGSRTIIHVRDLPELDERALQQCSISEFDWLHFEGRNIENVQKMMASIYESGGNSAYTVSVEIEKPREGVDVLGDFSDIILFSKVYALSLGFDCAADFIRDRHQRYPTKILVCAWGEGGACGCDESGVVVQVEAVLLEEVIDTVAAGDVFNAAVIHALSDGVRVKAAVEFAVQFASASCAQKGISDLVTDTLTDVSE